MRGTRGGVFGRERQAGIIPAYAGNTGCPSVRPCVRWDHPRVCGEHFNAVRNATSPQGSSPRMRGTLQLDIQLCGAGGIIPAYAGNTATCRCIVMNSRDHPRVCGEHYISLRSLRIGAGSSPRMRGTPAARAAATAAHWIIPAYAGNTPTFPWSTTVARDHPRVCGEHCS